MSTQPEPLDGTCPLQPTVYGGGRVPHRCPVCNGVGTVPDGFYNPPPTVDWGPQHVGTSTVPMREPCRACSGTGILWS